LSIAVAQDLSPHARLSQIVSGSILSQAVYAAANLRLADHLLGGPQTATHLARATGAHAGALYRLLRTLASVEIFSEAEDERFSLTPMAECLLSDSSGSLRHMVLMMGSKWRLRAWEEIEHSIKTGRPAFDAVFGMAPFEYFRRNPEAASVFHQAMVSYTSSIAPAIAAAYDFSGCRRIVDVAGGHGYLLATILKDNPEAQGVLFDLPEVVKDAAPLLKREGVTARCEIVGGNFFETIAPGGDTYILKQIIHDWDDDPALKILNNCRRAMAPGARLLLIEAAIPPGNEPSHAKLLDLEVLVALGGKERTEAQYRELYSSAGLRLTRNVTTAVGLQILEGVKSQSPGESR
jgi:hypothetical protein